MVDEYEVIPIPRAGRSVATSLRNGGTIQQFQDAGLGEAIRSSNISVGNSPTPLPSTPLEHRKSINIENHGSNIIYVGDENVAAVAGGGIKVAAGASRSFQLSDGVTLYGVVATNSSICNVFEAA